MNRPSMMASRRQFLLEGAVLAAVTTCARNLAADERDGLPDGSAAKDMITRDAQQAIDQGLAYLAKSQHRDGYFGTGQYQGNVAVTSLAALAFMAGLTLATLTGLSARGTLLLLETTNADSLSHRVFGSDWEGYFDRTHMSVDACSARTVPAWVV